MKKSGTYLFNEIPSKERRKNSRLPCRLKAIRSSPNGYFIEDQIVEISRSGFSLLSSEQLKIGDRLEVMVTLKEGMQELTLQGEVVDTDLLSDEDKSRSGRSFCVRAGLYLTFVEPSQKQLLRSFLSYLLDRNPRQAGIAKPQKNLRIRIHLEGQELDRQAHYLQAISDRGLFIEVAYPISLFDEPRIRLTNPLTQEQVELLGEISQVQLTTQESKVDEDPFSFFNKERTPQKTHRYGVAFQFPNLSAHDRRKLERLVLGLSDGKKFNRNSTRLHHPPSFTA